MELRQTDPFRFARCWRGGLLGWTWCTCYWFPKKTGSAQSRRSRGVPPLDSILFPRSSAPVSSLALVLSEQTLTGLAILALAGRTRVQPLRRPQSPQLASNLYLFPTLRSLCELVGLELSTPKSQVTLDKTNEHTKLDKQDEVRRRRGLPLHPLKSSRVFLLHAGCCPQANHHHLILWPVPNILARALVLNAVEVCRSLCFFALRTTYDCTLHLFLSRSLSLLTSVH